MKFSLSEKNKNTKKMIKFKEILLAGIVVHVRNCFTKIKWWSGANN